MTAWKTEPLRYWKNHPTKTRTSKGSLEEKYFTDIQAQRDEAIRSLEWQKIKLSAEIWGLILDQWWALSR